MVSLGSSLRQVLRERDFVVLLGCCFLLGLGHSFVLPFMSIFGTKEVGMSPVRFGVFMTVTTLACILVSTSLARASDLQWSRKSVLVVGGLTGALGHFGYAFARDFWSLLAVGTTLMAISSVTFSQVFATARDLLARHGIAPKDVPLYLNVFRVCFALAWTAGPAIAAWVMKEHSFEGTFSAAASLFVLFTLTVQLFVPRLPPGAQARAAAAALPLREALKTPLLLPHFVGFSIYFACSTMGMMNLPLLILNTLRGTEAQVGWAFSIAPVFELPFMLYLGVLATRMDHGLLIRGSLVVATAYYFGLSLAPSPLLVYPLQILSAAIVAIMGGVAITFFQNFLPDQAGTATNLYTNAMRVGSTAGYLIFGGLMGTFGHRAIFTVCCVGAFSSFVLLFFARKRSAVDPAVSSP